MVVDEDDAMATDADATDDTRPNAPPENHVNLSDTKSIGIYI